MTATATRDPLALVGVLARRGEHDLRALAAVIRGEPLDPDRVDTLRRAGLLRAGERPRVPAKIVAPVLALESALGLRGDGPLGQLLGLLKGAAGPSERDMLLGAMADQLAEHLDELGAGKPLPARAELRQVLDDLKATIGRLDPAQADPAYVTRVSELCARVIEQLAGTLTVRRARRHARPLPVLDVSTLAAAARGLTVTVCAPLRVPSPAALARALTGTAPLPAATARRDQLTAAPGRHRKDTITAALATADPLNALYAAQDPQEALRRHATLLSLGADGLASAGWRPSSQLAPGPAPLAWATRLDRVSGAQRSAA